MLVATYTGTISTGYDYSGVFGAPNTSLIGDSYTAVYYIDTSLDPSLSDSSDTRAGILRKLDPGLRLGHPLSLQNHAEADLERRRGHPHLS